MRRGVAAAGAVGALAIGLMLVARDGHPPAPVRAIEAVTVPTPAEHPPTHSAVETPTTAAPVTGAPRAERPPEATADPDNDTTEPGFAAAEGVHAWSVARGAFSDAQFYRVAGLLERDPAFRAALVTEFQTERDPVRLRWLAWLLGESSDPSMTDVAAQMLGGELRASRAALQLLGRRQRRDARARAAIVQVLDGGRAVPVLIEAMNAVAKPSDSPGEREALAAHLMPLSAHADPRVRAVSVALLFRNAPDAPAIAARLASALGDADPRVRRNAAQGFAARPGADPGVTAALLALVENPDEAAEARRAAVRALQQRSLSADQRARLQAVSTGR